MGPGTLRDVPQILIPCAEQVGVVIDGGRDEGRRSGDRRVLLIHFVLRQRRTVREVPEQLLNEFPLLRRRRTVAGHQLHAVSRGDVPQISFRATPGTDVAGLQDESRHTSAPCWDTTASSRVISPLVSFTLRMHWTRSFRRVSRSTGMS